MEMPRPAEAHRKLERIVGSWRGEETMYPSQWSPEGSTAVGLSEVRLALNGFAAIVDYEQEGAGGVTFRGHGVYTYDAEEGCYVLHWFDCMGGPPEVFRGRFEDDTLMMARSGPDGHLRLTWHYGGHDQLIHRMEMSLDGREWKMLMEGVYTREG